MILKNLFKKMSKEIKGYKGFDKDMKCRGFQYEVGKEYNHDGDPSICSSGFHFCENPLDCLNYYKLGLSVFHEVEGSGKIDKEKCGDTKVSCSQIKIGVRLSLEAMIKASVDFIWKKASTGEVSDKNSATSGSYAHSATSGERANSATSGYGAHSATSGSDGIACSVGRKAKAKASLGCFIVLAEWIEGKEFTDAKPIDVKSAKVDGKKIKADTWYKLKDGKFVVTDEANE